MLHSAAVPPGLFEALQGWQHHLCPRLPVKVQWFCLHSLILRLMLVPIKILWVLFCTVFNLFQSELGETYGKKHHIPHLSQHLSQLLSPFWELPLSLYESTAKIGEAPAHAVEFPQLDLLQEPGPLGLLSLVRNSEKMVTIW